MLVPPALLSARVLRDAVVGEGEAVHMGDTVRAVAGLLSHQQTADLSPAQQM
ncbi:hypothetical protein ACFQ6V_07310 [Streptomyces roseifaciens]